PGQRFQSAAEFKAALQATQGTVVVAPAAGVFQPGPAARAAAPAERSAGGQPRSAGVEAPAGRPPSRPPSQPPGQPAAGRRPRTLLWFGLGGGLLALLLCLAAGGGFIALLAPSPSPTPLKGAQVDPSPTPQTASPSPTPVVDARFRSKDPATLVYADFNQPDTLDPALDYETSGLAVIQNLYDTLIFYDRESPVHFVPQLALEVPTLENGGIAPDGLTYTFKLRPGVRFHDGSPLTVDDVAYTFRRGILQGGSTSPQWLLTEPLFGSGIYDAAALVDASLVDRPAELQQAAAERLQAACRRVLDAIQPDPAAGTVTFRLQRPWAPFLATLANGWGGIRSRAWAIANGGWDGDCSTWQNYYGRSSADLNQTQLGLGGMGSGPYKIEHWTVDQELVLLANQDYWRSEAAWPGGPSGPPRLKRIVIQYVPDLQERVARLQRGEVDAVNLESQAEWPALDPLVGLDCGRTDQACKPTAKPDAPLERIRSVPLGTRQHDVTFNWSINARDGNELIGSGQLDGAGIPPDFFANLHVRRAFAACFNYDRYLADVLQGEGIRAITVMLPDMIGYDANAPYYVYEPKRCEDELRQAVFDGRSVWDSGFRVVFPYNESSRPRQVIAETLRDEFAALGERFQIEARPVGADGYSDWLHSGRLPYTTVGWVEDVHDPHNWAYPYTLGTLGSWQYMDQGMRDKFQAVLNLGVESSDPDRRAAVYRDFNQLYYEQALALLLFQSVGRHYQQRWVDGWYGNPVFPGLYYYTLSKQ
ncbi:MAG: ABC transporter substrate-binding protein, partial [Chloroflexota bacterium]